MVRLAFSSGGPPLLAGHPEASRSSCGHGFFTANAALGTLLATSPRPVPALSPSGRHHCRNCPSLTAIADTLLATIPHPLARPTRCRLAVRTVPHPNSSIIAYIENGITM